MLRPSKIFTSLNQIRHFCQSRVAELVAKPQPIVLKQTSLVRPSVQRQFPVSRVFSSGISPRIPVHPFSKQTTGPLGFTSPFGRSYSTTPVFQKMNQPNTLQGIFAPLVKNFYALEPVQSKKVETKRPEIVLNQKVAQPNLSQPILSRPILSQPILSQSTLSQPKIQSSIVYLLVQLDALQFWKTNTWSTEKLGKSFVDSIEQMAYEYQIHIDLVLKFLDQLEGYGFRVIRKESDIRIYFPFTVQTEEEGLDFLRSIGITVSDKIFRFMTQDILYTSEEDDISVNSDYFKDLQSFLDQTDYLIETCPMFNSTHRVVTH